jgi:hypothetical protein
LDLNPQSWCRSNSFPEAADLGSRPSRPTSQLSDFAYYEAVVPGQSYDLMLILNADSFAFFDHRRPFPHYVALFQKTGVHEGRRILSEMLKWEADVSVSLLRAYGADR